MSSSSTGSSSGRGEASVNVPARPDVVDPDGEGPCGCAGVDKAAMVLGDHQHVGSATAGKAGGIAQADVRVAGVRVRQG